MYNVLMNQQLWEEQFKKFDRKGIPANERSYLAFPEDREKVVLLLLAGKYRFDAPKVVKIPKDNGKLREILLLGELDRMVMSVLTAIYAEAFKDLIDDTCFSYQEGKSVRSALYQLKGKLPLTGWKVDLTNYFGSVPLPLVEEALKKMKLHPGLDAVLWEFYHDNRVIRDGVEQKEFKSLAQGIAFSSVLANICLADIDKEVKGLCEYYCRYSDDIILLGEGADSALALLEKRLGEIGLTLNPEKKEKIDGEFTFLGGKITKDYIHLSDRKIEKVMKMVKKICKSSKHSRAGQRSAIRRIQRELLTEVDGYSWLQHLADFTTDNVDLERLDHYCRTEIKSVLTGKHNFTKNNNKTSDEQLKEMGWVKLEFLGKLPSGARQFFSRQILEPNVTPTVTTLEHLVELTPQIALLNTKCRSVYAIDRWWTTDERKDWGDLGELWTLAKYYEGKTNLPVVWDVNRMPTGDEVKAWQTLALHLITSPEPEGLWTTQGDFTWGWL